MSVVRLADVEEHVARTGAQLSSSAARWLGHRLASELAEAHANVDEAGDLAPIVNGRLSAETLLVTADGDVTIVGRDEAIAEGLGAEAATVDGGRLTPRADVHALGGILRRLVVVDGDVEGDEELARAIETAMEPTMARRKITCVEIEALLARGADLTEGRRALAAMRAAVEAARARPPRPVHSRTMSRPATPLSRPLSGPVRIGVALATASLVYAAGIAIVERISR